MTDFQLQKMPQVLQLENPAPFFESFFCLTEMDLDPQAQVNTVRI